MSLKKKSDTFTETTTSPTKNLDADEDLTDRESSNADLHNSTDNENEGRLEITVKSCVKGQKLKWDKRHYCVYCKKTQSKMARHLKRKHSNQKEVEADILCERTSTVQPLKKPKMTEKRGKLLFFLLLFSSAPV